MNSISVKTDFGQAIGFFSSNSTSLIRHELTKSDFGSEHIDCVLVDLGNTVGEAPGAFLSNLEVDPVFWGQGHGVELLNCFLTAARDHGARVVILVCDLDRTQRNGFRLSEFYARAGFNGLESFDELGVMVKVL